MGALFILEEKEMKKTLSLILAVLMIVSTFVTMPVTMTAATGTGETSSADFEYFVNDDGTSVTITRYVGQGGDVVIPSKIDGYDVTIIGNSNQALLRGNPASVTSITVPNSVTRIDHFAFQYAYDLRRINLGSGVRSIGNWVFTGCNDLVAITVDGENSTYCDIDGVLYSKDKKQ